MYLTGVALFVLFSLGEDQDPAFSSTQLEQTFGSATKDTQNQAPRTATQEVNSSIFAREGTTTSSAGS